MISKINVMPRINFGAHYLTADVGASTKNGSLKIKALSETGEVIAEQKTTVFQDGEQRNELDFESKIAERIAGFEANNKLEILAKDSDDEALLTVCYPGPKVISGGENSYEGIALTNFYYDDGRSQPFKRPIDPKVIDAMLVNRGVNVVKSRHVNDMAATGASVLNKLKSDHPEVLQQGREILFLYPGGGLGSGVIMVDGDNIKIKPTEKQHALASGTHRPRILEKDACSPGLISNYAATLNVDKALIAENTKVIDNYEEAKRIFPSLTPYEHNEASMSAIGAYMSSLSQIIARQICDGKTNTVVLTGPIANGIQTSVNNNPDWKVDNSSTDDAFTALMKQMIRENLLTVGQKLMGEDKDFTILVLPNLDNTTHSHILQNGEQIGEPAAWYNIKS